MPWRTLNVSHSMMAGLALPRVVLEDMPCSVPPIACCHYRVYVCKSQLKPDAVVLSGHAALCDRHV
jgi:hypothetical protein